MWRAEVPYNQFPRPLAESVPESGLLWACSNPDRGTIVVWTGTDRRLEREFSVAEGRFLTHAERERALPSEREFSMRDLRVRVVQDACLLPASDIRYERYRVQDIGRNLLITECGQEFFDAVYQDPEELVADAVRQARLPERYRREWSRSERVSHWTLWLHRGRRWAGEDGHDEDAAFTPAAWQYMRETDPEIEDLLPDIIDELAQLWLTNPDQMLAEFRRRAGV